MYPHNIPRKCAKFGCLTKYLLGRCWLFDCSCAMILLLVVCVIHMIFLFFYFIFPHCEAHFNQRTEGNAQITDTYYFTFHPCQILCNFFAAVAAVAVGYSSHFFVISFSHPSSLTQSVVLIIIVSSPFHADYFGQTHTLMYIVHIHTNTHRQVIFSPSSLLLLIDFDWTKKKIIIITIINNSTHNI